MELGQSHSSLIPQWIADLVAYRFDVIDRPHPFLIKPGLRDQGLAVGSEQSIFDDEIRQIVAIEQFVKAGISEIPLRFLIEEHFTGSRAERMSFSRELLGSAG